MAFRSNNPISLVFPPFRGVTRRIILTALLTYFGTAALGLYSPSLEGTLIVQFVLRPDQALRKLVWELVTYPFFGEGLLSVAFALLSLWFFGSALEDERGPRWLTEYFLVATIGGAAAASALGMAVQSHVSGLAKGSATAGMWPFVLAVMIAYAHFHPEEQLNFNFIFKIKAKYLATIYVLLYLGMALASGARFEALVGLCNGLFGYLFLILAPRKGLRVGMSERWFKVKNAYYRSKRRRAAKKFKVYMRKQGKEVSLDSDGRYVDPDGRPRDPNDRHWMN